MCETVDVSARNPATVGKLVLDLAELARALDGRDNELRLPLSTSAAVSAVCQPFLTLCVRRAQPRGASRLALAATLTPRHARAQHARRWRRGQQRGRDEARGRALHDSFAPPASPPA